MQPAINPRSDAAYFSRFAASAAAYPTDGDGDEAARPEI
jgi:hypothetical protein